MTETRPTLRSELDLFQSVLTDARKSPYTVETYAAVVKRLAEFCEAHDRSTVLADIDLATIRAFRAERAKTLRDTSQAVEHRSMQAFWKWACYEPSLDDAGPNGGRLRSPMSGLEVPKIIQQPRGQVTEEQHAVLLRIVALEPDRLTRTRNEAILHLFHATGARLSELSNLRLDDCNMTAHEIVVTGKGGGRREIPFTTKTHVALARYLKLRSRSRYAALPWLWVGVRGRFTRWGVGATVTDTAKEAGYHLSAHSYRHAFAASWLERGGEEGDLMMLAGWTSRDMLQRVYGRADAARRAKIAYRRVMDARD